MISSIILMGRFTKDLQIKYTKNNKTFIMTTIACDDGGKLVDGIWKTDTQFLPVIFWDKQAETVNKYFKKGDAILIEGSIKYENRKENENYVAHFLINTHKIVFLPNKNKESSNENVDNYDYENSVLFKENDNKIENENYTTVSNDFGDDILW